MQELLLRHCTLALQAWHHTAAMQHRRNCMMADCFRNEQMLKKARLMLKAWQHASEAATAQTCFILQSLSTQDRAGLRTALKGWQGRCQLTSRVNAIR